jgi:RNA polymerase sigma factor (sigma-70 family)
VHPFHTWRIRGGLSVEFCTDLPQWRIDRVNLQGYFTAELESFRATLRSPLRMLDQKNAEALFLEHLAWIDKVAALAARKHGLWDADADDFASWVKMRMVESGYSVFQKFRGESELRTFIAVVVSREAHAYLRERKGRWRPSAKAQALGPPAPELEKLVRNDGYTLNQAGEKLRTAGRTKLSDLELARLLDQLPEKPPLRPKQVPDEGLNESPGPSSADEVVTAGENEAYRSGVMAALARAMANMTPEEQLIVKLRFGQGATLAHVARTLGLEQKPLYRRIEKLRKQLHDYLVQEGISAADVRALLDREGEP